MKKLLYSFLILSATLTGRVMAQEPTSFPKGEKAPNVHHTGDVWLYHVSEASKKFDYNISQATFAPGAKLDWHLHPAGQQLLITAGTGYYQERDKPVQVVKAGDVVKCLPGVAHWHAATPTTGVTYLAITGNKPTKWLEPVSDDTFQSIKAPVATSSKNVEQELKALSLKKWQWMADTNVDSLATLFHDQSMFVHMGGSWGRDQELRVIESGRIWYKKADVYSASVNVIGNTAILLNDIDLVAVVGGNEVINPFMVTEVYTKENGEWKMGSLTFSKLSRPVRADNNPK